MTKEITPPPLSERRMAQNAATIEKLVQELASLVRRLSYVVKRSGLNDGLVHQSVDFLKRFNLGGSVIRTLDHQECSTPAAAAPSDTPETDAFIARTNDFAVAVIEMRKLERESNRLRREIAEEKAARKTLAKQLDLRAGGQDQLTVLVRDRAEKAESALAALQKRLDDERMLSSNRLNEINGWKSVVSSMKHRLDKAGGELEYAEFEMGVPVLNCTKVCSYYAATAIIAKRDQRIAELEAKGKP